MYPRDARPGTDPVPPTKDRSHRPCKRTPSASTGTGSPSRTHSYDTGAAWQNVALQGCRMGLVVHGMAGFDYDRARDVVGAPEECAVEAMIAVGRPAPVETLTESLREREIPSGRKAVAEFAFPGVFRTAG